VGGQCHAQPLYPQERPGTHCIGGWMGPRASLDRRGKSYPHRDSIPRPSSPWRVTIPTELTRPTCAIIHSMQTEIKLSSHTSFCGGCRLDPMWKKKRPIAVRTIRSIGNTCKNTVYQSARCCNEEKNTKHNKIIKGKS